MLTRLSELRDTGDESSKEGLKITGFLSGVKYALDSMNDPTKIQEIRNALEM